MLSKIIKKIKYLQNKRKIKNLLKNLHQHKSKNILRLGSVYGGWYISENKNLNNSTIISCGLGQDASFDIEFLNRYNGKIIFVDPTPAAIDHFEKILQNLGNKKKENYKKIGKQNISSYDLSNIKKNQLYLINKALYDESNKKLKFFSPPDKNHVSHSLNNWQNNYSEVGNYIYVNTISIKKILIDYNLEKIELLKLDIEGAEIEVIESIMKSKIFPSQICVEFDELHLINEKSSKRFIQTYNLLIENGYNMVETNEHPNFLFIRKEKKLV